DAPGFFPLPEGLIEGPGARIMSLKDGTKKMSKSDPAENSRINLIDDADTIARKIKKSKTDTLGDMPETIEGLDGRPEIANLVGIYAALAGLSDEQVLNEYGGKGFGTFKPALADLAVSHLSPITQDMRRLMDDPAEIDAALAKGTEKAKAIAEPMIEEVRRLVGFWQV
ncbi:MAG: tryptophan--tRNA ligase, partial [Pseudomonadota bacterium]